MPTPVRPQSSPTRRQITNTVSVDELNNMPLIGQAADWLAHAQVLVGIPSDNDTDKQDETGGSPHTERRDDAPIGNAALGYIHEHGSPINNIPARPWLYPGVANSKSEWMRYMRQAADAAMRGDQSLMERAFHAAGMTAVSAVKARITAGIDPPVRRHRDPDHTALIDTAQMLNSISYIVRRE